MKLHLLSILLFSSLLLHSNLYGQAFEVPEGYAFETKADFVKYEPQLIQAVTWLESTPINQDSDKRKEVNSFVFKYIEGSPSFSVGLQPYVMSLTEKNPDLLVAFMGGWAKYQLQNPTATDPIKLNAAGVKTILQIYKLGGANKNKNIEKLLKLASEQELDEWVKSKLS